MTYKIFFIFFIFSIQFTQTTHSLETTLETTLPIVKKNNLEIKEAEWGIEYRKGQYAEAKAGLFPKLESMGIIAPMYKITGNSKHSESDFKVWNPYFLFDGRIILPLFTFGKVSAYKNAAENGIQVAIQEKRIKESDVILQTKEYYYQYQMAKTMFVVVKEVKKILEEAIKTAEKILRKKNGEIKKQSLLKLKVFYSKALEQFELTKKGIILAKGAVLLQMGFPQSIKLKIVDGKLKPVSFDFKNLKEYLDLAKSYRPEYKMAIHGAKATRSLVDAEKANHYPNFFLGGQLKYRQTNAVEDQQSTFAFDDYNYTGPGIGIGLQWNWDYGTTSAKIKQAKAKYMEVLEKSKRAEIGIPMDIKRRYYEVKEAKNNMDNFSPAMKAAKEWMIIEIANYSLGINEAKDLLEAVGASAMSKFDYYNSIFNYNMAVARLTQAVGKEVSNIKYD